MLTWLQAQAACGLAGKHLCTNDEWQVAAEGTVDPGSSNGAGGACVTSDSPRAAGQGSACRSSWGAEDMIGNLWEWTAEWVMEPGWNGSMSTWADVGDGLYGADGYWHGGEASSAARGTDGSHLVRDGSGDARLPAAALRGGYWGDGTDAGLFAVGLDYGPSHWNTDSGFRCCRSR